LSRCVKVDTLGRLYDNNLERSYNHFTTTNVYFIGAVYNSYFLIIYKPSSLIISPQTFSTQLGAGTAWFCLSQYAIPFCTLSPYNWKPTPMTHSELLTSSISECTSPLGLEFLLRESLGRFSESKVEHSERLETQSLKNSH